MTGPFRQERKSVESASKELSRRKALVGGIGLGLSVSTFGKVFHAAAQDVTLGFAWWGPPKKTEWTFAALEVVHEKLPDVRIEGVNTDFGGYFDKLSTQVAGGAAPDAFSMMDYMMREYSDRGALLDLGQFGPEMLDFSDWDEELVATGMVNDTLYGVPTGVNAFCLYFDQTVLDELEIPAPENSWTWDDFRNFVVNVSEAGGDGYYGTEDMGGEYEHFQVFIRQQGKDLYTTDGGAGFSADDVRTWWEFWQELRSTGATVPFEDQTAAQFPDTPFFRGEAALRTGYSAQYINIQDLTDHKFFPVIIPNGPEGSEPGMFVRPSLHHSGYSETEYPEDVVQFINLMVNDPDVVGTLRTGFGFPSNPVLRKEMRSSANPVEEIGFEYMEVVAENSSAAPPPPPPGSNQVIQEFGRYNAEVGFGRSTAAEAAEQFLATVEDILGS